MNMQYVVRGCIIGDVDCQGLARIVLDFTVGSRVCSNGYLQSLLDSPDAFTHKMENVIKAAQLDRAEQRKFSARMTRAYIHQHIIVGPVISNLVQSVQALRLLVCADHSC